MIFSYSRVSSKSQDTQRQTDAIREYAERNDLTIDREFIEKASGKDFDRPIYQSLKLTLREKDCLIIKELDRLGRNMDAIKDEWRELEKMGVDIIVTDYELLNTSGKTDLERKLISNIVFELLSYVAHRERERLRTRQAEGIAIGKSKGVYKGRKPISVNRDEFERVYRRWADKEITGLKAMELLGVKKDVFYRLVAEKKQTGGG
jgi:DNA invertase Pin-like site-specific DNA recombinase